MADDDTLGVMYDVSMSTDQPAYPPMHQEIPIVEQHTVRVDVPAVPMDMPKPQQQYEVKTIRMPRLQHTRAKIVGIIVFVVMLLSIGMTAEMFILYQGSVNSVLLLAGFIVSLLNVLLLGFVLYWHRVMRSFVFTTSITAVIFSVAVVAGLTFPIVVYKQAPESFWALFLLLPIASRIFLILLLPTVTALAAGIWWVLLLEPYHRRSLMEQMRTEVARQVSEHQGDAYDEWMSIRGNGHHHQKRRNRRRKKKKRNREDQQETSVDRKHDEL